MMLNLGHGHGKSVFKFITVTEHIVIYVQEF
ncbi:hypothetical protein NXF25_005939 [Crotalus adamanteus]|uniref:Uncharacterized protein n=1 Tax=Crotalus adamanteus TaxID=8729 RepID=A0AAW1BYL6_CROAD